MKAIWTQTAACAAAVAVAGAALAQDAVITNARILDGKGGVIENGTIVIVGGKIASVAGAPPKPGLPNVIDAQGRTVLPGYIDAHRHLANNLAPADMQKWLDAGFTTIQDALAFNVDGEVALRKRIESGEIPGPRLKISGLVPVDQGVPPAGGGEDAGRTDQARLPVDKRTPAQPIPPDQVRAMVDAMAKKGVDNIKTILVIRPGGNEVEALKAISDEAHKDHLRSVTHATSVTDAVGAIEGHTDVLMHTPHMEWVDENGALDKIKAAGVPMVSTLGVFTPYFGAEGSDVYRDFKPFPEGSLHSAGQGPVNARLLWDAGVTVGYGTDTNFSPRESLRHEERALSSVFAPADIVKMLTINAAIASDVDKVTGSIEPGKAADIVMIKGDPLTDIAATLDVVLVLKDGKIVADKRKE
jgi:imidazolonepropionase-like amidohydrolase